MRILILGLNYAPELVGIGRYTGEMAEAMAAAGHEVEVIAAKPYYPAWRVTEGFGAGYRTTSEAGVRVVRCPLYVPADPTGLRRIIHHLSFAASSVWPMARATFGRRRPDLVMAIAPSLMSVPVARFFAWLCGAKSWLHIQDFEVGAAFATGLIGPTSLIGKLALRFEKIAQAGFDFYSTISPPMCRRLIEMGIATDRVYELRNWSDVTAVTPLSRPSKYRANWDIHTPHIALYSGNISNKQGIDIVLKAARMLCDRDDLTFVICGDGPSKEALVKLAVGLPNIRFYPLQPNENLRELLALATIHLLPQLEGAADLVLPSKLTNMLASGRPVIATAAPGTGLADEVTGCGLIVTPGDAAEFTAAITTLMDDPERYRMAAHHARDRAERRWAKDMILDRLDGRLREVVSGVDPASLVPVTATDHVGSPGNVRPAAAAARYDVERYGPLEAAGDLCLPDRMVGPGGVATATRT